MTIRALTGTERVWLGAALACLLIAVAALVAGAEPATREVAAPDAPVLVDDLPAAETDPQPVVVPGEAGAAETLGPTPVLQAPEPGAPVLVTLRAGVLLPVTGRHGDFLSVQTPCLEGVWVAATGLHVHPPAAAPATSLRDATIVVDPGHGGTAPGAVGPGGLTEKGVNLHLSRMLANLLRSEVDGHGPARVFLTRNTDHDGTLAYRAALANALRADAFLSIHNNAAPDGPTPVPGTETYYQVGTPEHVSAASKRLAGLAYDELFATLRHRGTDWVGDRDAGAKYRRNAEGGDYYGILRRSEVPASLLEVLFISNPPEEQLLLQPDVQEDIARALHRALIRYTSTADPGSGFVEPYPRGTPAGGPPARCVDPQ